VTRVFQEDFGRNIFQIPIDERPAQDDGGRLVERASISRIWPNRLVVRVWERTPVAFVDLTSEGARNRNVRLALIDATACSRAAQKLDFSSPILPGCTNARPSAAPGAGAALSAPHE